MRASSQMKYSCCFLVKNSADSASKSLLYIPWQSTETLELLRMKLWTEYKVPKDRRIFYIDDDGDSVPIDSDCELQEALKLARKCFNNLIQLIVGSFEETSSKYSWFDETYLSEKKQSKNTESTLMIDTQNPYESWYTLNHKFFKSLFLNKQIALKQECNSIMKKVLLTIDAEHDKPNETKILQIDEQVESKVDTQEEANASSLQCSNCTLPPLWFTEYMESMKKDMMSTMTTEVVKNVSEVLEKRLDSFALLLLKDLESSLAKRYPQCSSDSNEKNQEKIESHEQLSSVPIKRTDESRNAKDMQIKKKTYTITNGVVHEVSNLVEIIPPDPLMLVPPEDQSQSQSQLPSSTSPRYSFDSHSSEKNPKVLKTRLVAWGQPNDNGSDLTNELIRPNYCSYDEKTLQPTSLLKTIPQTSNNRKYLERNEAEMSNIISKSNLFNTQKKKTLLESKLHNKQFAQNIYGTQDMPWKDSIDQSRTERGSNETAYLEPIEKDLRMSCSVTGNQMLDEGRLSKDTLHNFHFITDNLNSCWSNNQKEKGEEEKDSSDDDAFEIIQMPDSNDGFTRFLDTKPQEDDSSRDSPSFELLSEPASPPSSIHLNEDHFSADEERLEEQSRKTNSANSIYVDIIQENIFNYENQSVNVDECVGVDSKKQLDIPDTFIMDEYIPSTKEAQQLDIPDTFIMDEYIPSTKEAHSSKSCTQHQSNEQKSPRDDGSCDDVRNSHASYLTVQNHCDSKTQSQCSCQSQTDSSDFTQSFHSHTTSVTDTTDMYAHAYANKYNESTTANNVIQDVRPPCFPLMEPQNPWKERNARADGDWTKETKTNKKLCHDEERIYPKYSCALNNNYACSWDPSFDDEYQSFKDITRVITASDNIDSIDSSIALAHMASKISAGDSVHILPETLVSAAAQVGSFAFDAAREMFDKIRAHTKEDPLKKNRGGVKWENKKPNHPPFY